MRVGLGEGRNWKKRTRYLLYSWKKEEKETDFAQDHAAGNVSAE